VSCDGGFGPRRDERAEVCVARGGVINLQEGAGFGGRDRASALRSRLNHRRTRSEPPRARATDVDSHGKTAAEMR
jgi:hypothetical protein